MNEHPLVARLRSLSSPEWFPGGRGNVETLENLEREYGLRLPEDYRELMLYANGGGLYEHTTAINLEPLETLMWHNLDERFQTALPGMFVIGDDGGGSVYFYDAKNRLGHGAYAVFLVPLGTLAIRNAIFVGHSITDVINRILKKEDLFAGPPYGKDL